MLFSIFGRNKKVGLQQPKMVRRTDYVAPEYELVPLTGEYQAWIQGKIEFLPPLIERSCPEYVGKQVNAHVLDALSVTYGPGCKAKGIEAEVAFGNVLGVALGELLRRQFDLEWRVQREAEGELLALCGPAGEERILMNPVNFVLKRFARDEFVFFEQAVPLLVKHCDDILNERR